MRADYVIVGVGSAGCVRAAERLDRLGARARGAACHRRLDHAGGQLDQHQRAHDHDRRKRGGMIKAMARQRQAA